MLGGVVAGQGEINVITLIGIAWAAAVAGDCASYLLGQRLGREFLVKHGPRFQITPERLEQVETFFANHGGKAIFIGRFVGIVRAVAPFLAGSGRHAVPALHPVRRARRGPVGDDVHPHRLRLLAELRPRPEDRQGGRARARHRDQRSWSGSSGSCAGCASPENRALLEQRVDAALDRPGLRVLRPVVRWAQGPLRFFIGRLTPGQLGLELTTLLAVAAVGSFAFFGYWILLSGADAAAFDGPVNDFAVQIENATAVDVAEGADDLRRAVADGAAVRARRRSSCLLRRRDPGGGGHRDRHGAHRRVRAGRQARARPPAAVERARRRGGLGLPVGACGVCDGVDRARRRRRPRGPGPARALVGRRRRDRPRRPRRR